MQQPKTDHDLLNEIHTMMMGANGQGGCFRSHEALKKDFYTFRRIMLIILAAAAGSSGLGFTIVELVKHL